MNGNALSSAGPAVTAGRQEDHMRFGRTAISAHTLCETEYDTVFRYVSRRVSPREEAEDITAETFAAAFQALPRFRNQCEPRLWLLGIARRKVADSLRSGSRRRESLTTELNEANENLISQSSVAPGPHELMEQAESDRKIREIVSGLNEDQREALLLKYVDGLSQAEIAVVLGKPLSTVNGLLQRARGVVFRQGRAYFLNSEENENAAV